MKSVAEFYRRRAQEERQAANEAQDSKVASVHTELADRYVVAEATCREEPQSCKRDVLSLRLDGDVAWKRL